MPNLQLVITGDFLVYLGLFYDITVTFKTKNGQTTYVDFQGTFKYCLKI